MDVPGNAGYSIFGDESLELWRDPLGYFSKRIDLHGPVFLGRIMNKPTIFITSCSTVKEMLCDNHENFVGGFQEYMSELFEENVMFLEGDKWRDVRELLQQTFSHDSNIQQTLDIARQLISDHIKNTPTGQPLQVYQHLKVLTTQLSISLFLSHTMSAEESQEVSQLMTTHWHGIISLPVNMKLPLLPIKSGYGKALAAKDKLLRIITEKLQNNEASCIAHGVHSSSPSHDIAVRNILLFISALFPKGMASLMTSILLQLSKPENSRYLSHCLNGDDQMLEWVILECQRLWPPFLGGRRICSKSCLVGGYRIPEGHPVVYIAYSANRDKAVFTEPNMFKPERWSDSTLDKNLLWSFGGGPRTCAGRDLATAILKEWLKLMLSSLSWQVSGADAPYKVLPVVRPSDEVTMVFKNQDDETSSCSKAEACSNKAST